jgi:hypothetical protein
MQVAFHCHILQGPATSESDCNRPEEILSDIADIGIRRQSGAVEVVTVRWSMD